MGGVALMWEDDALSKLLAEPDVELDWPEADLSKLFDDLPDDALDWPEPDPAVLEWFPPEPSTPPHLEHWSVRLAMLQQIGNDPTGESGDETE